MSIKTWTSRSDAINLLKERNLIINKHTADSVLKTTNYYLLINGLESLFLKTAKKHSYGNKNYRNDFYFEQFEFIYEFDRRMSDTIFNLLGQFEEKLKTAVAYNFCKNHCQTLDETMEYTNRDNYVNPNTRRGNYPFIGFQNHSLGRKFYNRNNKGIFLLFREDYLQQLIDTNDNIAKDKYKDSNYRPVHPGKVAHYYQIIDHQKQFEDDIAVPFWVAIQKMTLGTLNILCHYLSDDDLEDVMRDFEITNNIQQNKEVFLNCLDLLVDLRNNCAHGELITRFRTAEKNHVHNKIVQKMGVHCYNNNQVTGSKISLYDTILILSLFVNVSTVCNLFKNFKYRFLKLNSSLQVNGSKRRKRYKISRKYSLKLFDTFLYRIGKTGTNQYHSYKDWKLLEKNSQTFDEVFN